jgi:hypothetical protein
VQVHVVGSEEADEPVARVAFTPDGEGSWAGPVTIPAGRRSAVLHLPARDGRGDPERPPPFFVTTTGCATSEKPVRFKVVDGKLPPGMTLFTQGVSSAGITGRPTSAPAR